MANRILNAAFAVSNVSPSAKALSVSLADRADASDATCYPSHADSSRRTGNGRRQIQRNVAILENEGHIAVLRRIGRSNLYIVHPRHTDAGDSGAPASGDPATQVFLTPDQRPPVIQTPTTPNQSFRLRRPHASIQENIDLLEAIREYDEAEVLKAYLRKLKSAEVCDEEGFGVSAREST